MAQHISLYRKYRPDTWNKVIGQNHIVTTLINQIKSGTLNHAYLFTGTRGTGKTSCAKIFAKALNCIQPENGSPCNKCKVCLSLSEENNLDVIEMDAASNNSVDDIRELREKIQFPPAIANYKVYIIDEVHMLSGSAFNALLKTLEEPPPHAIFILATTEVNKLPQTILSRCMRFDFRLVSTQELTEHLSKIFDLENYKYEKKAIDQIAIHGEGSVRDTLSLADMCMSYSPQKLKYDDVLEILGSSDNSVLFAIAEAILSANIGKILEITSSIYSRGKGIDTFNKELSYYFRELIAIKNIEKYCSSMSTQEQSSAAKLVDNVDNYRLARILEILALAENSVRYSSQQKIVFDANLVKAAELYTEKTNEAFVSRITALEQHIKNGTLFPNKEQTNISPPTLSQKKTNDTLAEKPETSPDSFTKTISKGAILDFSENIKDDTEKETSSKELLFDQAKSCPSQEEDKRIMGKLIENIMINNGSFDFTYKTLAEIKDFNLDGTTLNINTDRDSYFEILKQDSAKNKILQALSQIDEGKYSFSINRTGLKTRNRSVEQLDYLKDIFDGKLKIK